MNAEIAFFRNTWIFLKGNRGKRGNQFKPLNIAYQRERISSETLFSGPKMKKTFEALIYGDWADAPN